jgi:anthranilate/para-aminobenzoate synthase component I
MRIGPFTLTTDLTTPVAAWLALADLGPQYLLESVSTGDRSAPRARYSLLGFGEATEVRLTTDTLTIAGVDEPAPQGRQATLDALRRALAAVPKPGPDHPELPFAGGLVGATGYDVARRLDRVRTQRRPSPHPEAAYVGTRSVLVFDHHTRRRPCCTTAARPSDSRWSKRCAADSLQAPARRILAAQSAPQRPPTSGL